MAHCAQQLVESTAPVDASETTYAAHLHRPKRQLLRLELLLVRDQLPRAVAVDAVAIAEVGSPLHQAFPLAPRGAGQPAATSEP